MLNVPTSLETDQNFSCPPVPSSMMDIFQETNYIMIVPGFLREGDVPLGDLQS